MGQQDVTPSTILHEIRDGSAGGFDSGPRPLWVQTLYVSISDSPLQSNGPADRHPFRERLNGRLRDERLSENWPLGVGDARRIIEKWRREYHEGDRTCPWGCDRLRRLWLVANGSWSATNAERGH